MRAGGEGLAGHVLAFARVLRAAGFALGPGRVLDAVQAAAEVGVERRDDLYWALHAVLVSRAEQHALFHEAFQLLWRAGVVVPPAVADLLEASRLAPPPARAPSRRLAEALPRAPGGEAAPPREEAARLAWSDREALRRRDFEAMSAEELREAERAVASLRVALPDVLTRRHRPDPRGARVDARATLRAAARDRGAIPLRWRSRLRRPPAVVVLCDVSGSMARYARLLLRFVHALAQDGRRLHAFTFATRLTDVSRLLRGRDPDDALARVGRAVADWDAGTRIGAALHEFNGRWSRRVLGQGAVVLLVTDGLDREDGRGLAEEVARLRRSCRRLVWLNPLLRFRGFEPRAAGVRAILPHVDEHRPVHDLQSLEELAEALRRPLRDGSARGALRAAARATPRAP